MKIYDVCILGGGAAGLITAASLNKDIKKCIIEKNKTLGRKLAATGGGRCNITNEACTGRNLVLDFFKSMGLETYADSEGRYYQIKATQTDKISLSSEPDFLIVIKLYPDGTWNVIYNGPGNPVWENSGKMQKNGQRPISLSKIKKLMG